MLLSADNNQQIKTVNLNDRDELVSVRSLLSYIELRRKTGAHRLPSGSCIWSGSMPSVTELRSTRKLCNQSETEEARLSVPPDDNREGERDLLSAARLVIELQYVLSLTQTQSECVCGKRNVFILIKEGLVSVKMVSPKIPIIVNRTSQDLSTWCLTSLQTMFVFRFLGNIHFTTTGTNYISHTKKENKCIFSKC